MAGSSGCGAEQKSDDETRRDARNRLATAGSGDVLAGIVGAFLARGADPFEAAAAGAHVHGRLLDDLPPTGVVAGDLLIRLVETLVTLGVDGPLEVRS